MKYQIQRHDGSLSPIISSSLANKIAAEAPELIPYTVDGVIYYENPKSIARIVPVETGWTGYEKTIDEDGRSIDGGQKEEV